MTSDAGSRQSSTVPPESAADPTRAPDRLATLRALFEEHGGYVWNTLRRLGVPNADLDDLTHDVFIQVQRRAEDFDPARPIRPWLFGFAFRIASQHRRRAHRHREAHAEPDAWPSPGPAPDEQLEAQDRRRILLAALEGIDLDRRAVFVMYEIDEVPMVDVAHALGIPVNTAYSRLRTARAEFAAAVHRVRAKRRDR